MTTEQQKTFDVAMAKAMASGGVMVSESTGEWMAAMKAAMAASGQPFGVVNAEYGRRMEARRG